MRYAMLNKGIKYFVMSLLIAITSCLNGNSLLIAAPQHGSFKQDDLGVLKNSLTFALKDMDVREVLKNLSDEIGKKLVIASDVRGKISISLKDATPEQALNEVVRKANLNVQYQGDVISITPNRGAEPSLMVERVFPLYTSGVEEITGVIEALISEQGSVFINTKGRVVLVRDYASNLDTIENILKQFDPLPKQIAVEAAILSVTLEDEETIGVKWSGLDSKMQDGKLFDWQVATEGFVLPAASSAGGLYTAVTYATISNFIEALLKVSSVKVLSRPKVLVLDGEEAQIIVGKKLGYRTMLTTASQNTMENIEFLEVGTQLKVTPRVVDLGTVLMAIHPEVSDGEISSEGLPTESTSEVTTQVMVQHGQTVVIGGMISDKKGKTVHAVPILGSIPLLGRLFKRTEDFVTKSEMIVLITPRLVGTLPDRDMMNEIENSKKHFK